MKHLFTCILCLAIVFPSGCTEKRASASTNISPDETPTGSIHSFTMLDIDGNEVSLSKYKDKVVVIVNVASKCGLTPQYEEIQAFYEAYQSKGVIVLGFPANNFLSQEQGSDAEIKSFCSANYGVTFDMFSKISVKGKDIHPLYKYLTSKELNGTTDAPVTWNFQKFVINKAGNVVASFSPRTTVNDAEFVDLIDSLIK